MGAFILVVGKTTVDSFIRLQYQLSGTDYWTATGTDQSIPPITKGGSVSRVWPDVGQASGQVFPAGTHKIRVCADVTGVINEWDEANNCSNPVSFTVSQ
ncbi:MAG: hypothetical protein V1876_00045 [Candidatus Peregrinibacteria bacterium]